MDVLKTFGDYYAKKDYANALLTLQKNPQALSSGPMNYNLGTVYSKLENWPLARYHFLAAHTQGFYSKEVDTNLELVESKLDLKKVEAPLTGSDHMVKGLSILSQGYLTTVSLLFLMIGLLAMRKSPSFRKVIQTFLFALIPLGLNFWITSWSRSVVLTTEPILEGPSKIFGPVGELPAGVLVITKAQGEWRQIIYPSRFQGWIRSSSLKELE